MPFGLHEEEQMHWGSQVEVLSYYIQVPNSTRKNCSNSYLLECSPTTQAVWVRFPTRTCLSWGALVEDGDDLGQVSPTYIDCTVW